MVLNQDIIHLTYTGEQILNGLLYISIYYIYFSYLHQSYCVLNGLKCKTFPSLLNSLQYTTDNI